MIPMSVLSQLVETRKKGTVSSISHNGVIVQIAGPGFKGIPVSVWMKDSPRETRWFNEIPSPKELEEVVTFLMGIIVAKEIHES